MKCQVVFCDNEADHEEGWFHGKIMFSVMVCKDHCTPQENHRPTKGATPTVRGYCEQHETHYDLKLGCPACPAYR